MDTEFEIYKIKSFWNRFITTQIYLTLLEYVHLHLTLPDCALTHNTTGLCTLTRNTTRLCPNM